MKTHYELLSVPSNAAADEIKRAFRREIARYHPDKVQHLGAEFQQMAAGVAADLTEAYRVLMDPALRRQYDEGLQTGAGQPAHQSAEPQARPPEPFRAPDPPPPPPPPPRPAGGAGTDVVRRAAIARLRGAAETQLDILAGAPAGFDLALESRPKKALFKKAEPGVRVLARVVPAVDAATLADVWPAALKADRDAGAVVVLLMGTAVAPAAELAAAVTEQRRRSRGAGPVVVPLDVRDWEALFPPETPAVVRALVGRLRSGA